MRIFCGLARDAQGVAAAVVNERGGVTATSKVTDDPYGYLQLCRMWVRHSEPSAVSLADDGRTQTLRELAAASGQPTTATNVEQVEDALDTAVQIARALAQGELSAAVSGGTPEAVRSLVNSMHILATGEFAAQGALIELLRQCHPATVAAWDDPTEPACLELLRTLPEPAHAAKADPKRLAESLREVADPARVEELATALSRAARNRDHTGADVAGAIAAQADAALSAGYAGQALAASLAAMFEEQESAPAPPPAPIPRPRRTEVKTPAAPQAQPAMPQRSRATAPPAAPPEPDTQPLPMPQDAGEDGGFPLMPPPPEFVDPLTTEAPVVNDPEPRHAEPPPPAAAPPRRRAARGGGGGDDLLSAPSSDLPELEDADGDLLIFSQARSAWFKGPGAIEDTQEEWSFEADEGWAAAEAASANRQEAAETTVSGLPRRVPQANLVPGSAILSDQRPVPIKRDATALASRTAGYFRGWGRARRETVGAGMGS